MGLRSQWTLCPRVLSSTKGPWHSGTMAPDPPTDEGHHYSCARLQRDTRGLQMLLISMQHRCDINTSCQTLALKCVINTAVNSVFKNRVVFFNMKPNQDFPNFTKKIVGNQSIVPWLSHTLHQVYNMMENCHEEEKQVAIFKNTYYTSL